jgi:signal transduction histidine kinase
MFKNSVYILFVLILSFSSISRSQIAKSYASLEEIKKLPLRERLDTLLSLGWILRSRSPLEAIKYNKEAIITAKKLRQIATVAKAYNYLGVAYRNISEYDSSYYYYKQALRYARLANDSTQIAYCYNNIGGYFGFKGQHFLALENIFKAIKIFKKLGNLNGLAFSETQAGLAYYRLKNYNEALNYYRDVVKIREKINYEHGVAVVKTLMADVYMDLGEIRKAEQLIEEARKIYQKHADIKGVATTLAILGQIETARGNYEKSLKLRFRSLKIVTQIKYFIGVVENNLGIALNYFHLNKLDSALIYLKNAEITARSKDYFSGYMKAIDLFFRIYSKKQDANKMSYYSHKLLQLKDSLYRAETILRNEEFRKLISLHELERINTALETEIKSKKEVLLYSFAIGLVFLFFFVVIIVQNRKIRMRSKQLAVALEEKDKLFSIVAHDLKNPFNSLLSFANFLLSELESGDYSVDEIKNGLQQMRSSSQKLLDMVENLLQWARSQTGKIQYNPAVYRINEIILDTGSYFCQSARNKGVELKLNVYENDLLCYCDKDMVDTVLRNLISNSIKFCKKGDKITVSVSENPHKNVVEITVQDTGVGIPEEKLEKIFSDTIISKRGTSGEKGTGLGLLLVKEMVEKNKGEIFVESKPGEGTKFTFTVPLAKEEREF